MAVVVPVITEKMTSRMAEMRAQVILWAGDLVSEQEEYFDDGMHDDDETAHEDGMHDFDPDEISVI
jgi:hypothetical protein